MSPAFFFRRALAPNRSETKRDNLIWASSSSASIKAAVEKLGKFQILEPLTEGQNAHSFRAHHLHLNRTVFLKLYDYIDSMANDVLREPQAIVAAMRMFRSANVVELFDAEVLEIEGEKYLCLQMEFVDGKSLLSLMGEGDIGQQDAVRLTAGVLNGLAHLHSRRILHRDLKPANIVVAANGTPSGELHQENSKTGWHGLQNHGVRFR